MNIGRICFGTSTFVAGRLLPHKDSEPGIRTLVQALSDGLGWVHSNPALGTQWAIREAWLRADRPLLRHAVKVECPLASAASIRTATSQSVERSLTALGTDRLDAAVIEIDLKGTDDLPALVDTGRVVDFFAIASHGVLATGAVDHAFAYCHSPRHMNAAMNVPAVRGLAAQFSPAERWSRNFFNAIEERSLLFLAMAPLWRGRLTAAPGQSGPRATMPLTWVLNHPQVTQAVITMSTVDHWSGVVSAADCAYDAAHEPEDFAAWGLEWPPDDTVGATPIS